MLWSSLSLEYIELSLPLGPLPWGVSILDFGTLLYPFVDCSLLAWFCTIQLSLGSLGLWWLLVLSFLDFIFFSLFSLSWGLRGSELWG